MSLLPSLGVDVFMSHHAKRPAPRLFLFHAEPKWLLAQVGCLSFEASWGGPVNLRAFGSDLVVKAATAAGIIGGWEFLKLAA